MAGDDDVDPAILIEERLKNLPPRPSPDSFINRVWCHSGINPEDYDPVIVAIGPFHHNEPHLKEMELHKQRFLDQLLQRNTQLNMEYIVNEMTKLEQKARNCYMEHLNLDANEFVHMLILDGCFILEFIRKWNRELKDDPVFKCTRTKYQVLRDLMVLNNQIPSFVIERLFDMMNHNVVLRCFIMFDNQIPSFVIERLFDMMNHNVGYPLIECMPQCSWEGRHLLEVVYNVLCSSFAQRLSNINFVTNDHYIPTAVRLHKAGITFTKSEGNSFLDIQFLKKKMIMPKFIISHLTASMFRNLIAYENNTWRPSNPKKRYVTDYVFFMTCLLDSPEDVRLLLACGVIDNHLESDRMVPNFMQRLRNYTRISARYSYSNISYDIIRMEKSRRNYFNGACLPCF